MDIELPTDRFPLSFEVPEQNLIRTFDNKNGVMAFLQEELTFWEKIREKSSRWMQIESLDILLEDLGRYKIRQAHNNISSTEEVASIVANLEMVKEAVAVFGSGIDGQLISQSMEESTANPIALAMAAAFAGGRNVHLAQLMARRSVLLDVVLAAHGASELARLRGQPKSWRAQADKALSNTRQQLKLAKSTQNEIDRWFEAHRTQLDKDITSATAQVKNFADFTTNNLETVLQQMQTLVEAKRDTIDADLAEKQSETAARLDELHNQVEARIKSLENFYTSKIVLEGPSRLWRTVRNRSRNTAVGALLTFAALLGVPGWLLSNNWTEVTDFLTGLIASSQTGFSLTAVAVITIPALAYGWLLRHLSRVFIHNLNLMSDAEYREVLATTFLGLAEAQTAGVTEAERVLVLNALFRPAPPHAPDDGPPSGLLDLLGKKP